MRGSAGLSLPARAGAALFAALALCAALWLAAQHPVAPLGVLAGVWCVAVATAWRPHRWLFWLPALMPVLNFFPWTGWWLVDESDLLVLAVLAGGHGRWAWTGPALRHGPMPRWWGWVGIGLMLCVAQACVRGWLDAPALPPHTGWRDALLQGLYADHLSAWNSVRVAKSFVWALLLAPLVRRAVREDRLAAGQAFLRGMLVGLMLVGALVLWERESQVGLLNFVSGYRTSAAFWEMHVGGGAIDAHLALAAPLALWAVWAAPTRWWAWTALGLLWLTIYVLLTTYSRGVVGAFVVVLLAWALAARVFHLPHDGHGPGRRRVVMATLIGLLIQGGVVIGAGAFLGDRLEQTGQDLLGRWTHWQRGAGLLQSSASDRAGRWWGLGMGRFTARYRALGVDGELPGRAEWKRDGQGRGVLTLSGPDSRDELALQFGLAQRVRLRDADGYSVRLRLSGTPGHEVLVSVCQRHLIHSLGCQWARGAVSPRDPDGTTWIRLRLQGHPLSVPRSTSRAGDSLPFVFTLSATQAGQTTHLRTVQLWDGRGRQLLQNTDFSAGLSHWMPAAQAYYQPWHIDNLYLDLLLELGLLGWLLLAALVSAALLAVYRGLAARDALAWGYGASVLGFLSIGALISVTEIPRVLLLALTTLVMVLCLWTKQRPVSCNRL